MVDSKINLQSQKRKNSIRNCSSEIDPKSKWKFQYFWHILLKYSFKDCELEVLASWIKRDGHDGHKKYFAIFSTFRGN